MRMTLSTQVVFVPQAPIEAPGPSLREQLTYPCTAPVERSRLLHLLHAVQLEHLLARVDSCFETPSDWQGASRLLYQSPACGICMKVQ